MLFPSICFLRTDNWVNLTNLFLVFTALVLEYLVFKHITSIHFYISLLVVFRVHSFTLLTLFLLVLIHLPHSTATLSLACPRFDYSCFRSLLPNAAASTHLPFSEATSPVNVLQFFHSSLITWTSISQHDMCSISNHFAVTTKLHILYSCLNFCR